MEIRNKIALVTGGAVRIGRSICEMLASEQAEVYCHFHQSEKEAIQLQKEMISNGSRISLLQGDLTDIRSVESMMRNIFNKSGGIDILINNAAIFLKTPIGTVKEQEWDALFSLNLKAAFFCTQAAGVQMTKQGSGKIINIGDAAGDNLWPSYIPYGITKSGIIAMTKGFAKALAPDVQVNCINPGPILLPESFSESEREKAVERTLLKREGSVRDIVVTVRYLLKDSDYITGSVFNIDGGRSIN
jgi:pteridine reductase